MSKYIKEFQPSEISILDIDTVCKDWNNKFTIYTWITDEIEKYTFTISGKSKNACKTKISKEQAMEIVSKLKLKHVKNHSFRSAGNYHSVSHIISEISRVRIEKKKREDEIEFIDRVLFQFEQSIK